MSDLDGEAEAAPLDSSGSTSPRRRWWRWAVAVVVLLWLVAAGWMVVAATSSMDAGADHLEAARSHLTVGSLVRGEQLDELHAASEDFDDAAAAANHWIMTPIEMLPWAGRQLRAAQSMTTAAAELADLGEDASQRMSEAVADGTIAPDRRPEAVSEVASIAEATRDALERVGIGAGRDLASPLRNAHQRLADATDKLDATLADVSTGGRGLAAFLAGPSRYLLLAAHNGEMRAGTGMFLSAGVLTATDGRLEVGDMQSTTGLRVPPGAVTLPEDLERNWGWTGPGQEWRNLAMSPDFPTTASVAADMWKAKTGEVVDGVMVLDVATLRRLVALVGEVRIDDQTITKDNVVQYVLVDQYRGVEPGADGADERRDRLSDLARAVVAEFDGTEWDAAELIEQLQGAVRGRHLLMWSSDPDQQAAWKAAGATGELTENSLMISLISQGGTKIDRWVEVTPKVTRARGDAEGTDHVEIDVGIRNDAPTGLPRYVAGPHRSVDPNTGVDEGVYAGIVSFNLPGSATNIALEGDPPLVAGTDGPTQVVARRVQLQRGATGSVKVSFDIPIDLQLELTPSAKLPTTTWDVNGIEVRDATPQLVPSR